MVGSRSVEQQSAAIVAVTLAAAIGVSLVVSLTTTPMMCARFLVPESERRHGWFYRAGERLFRSMLDRYETGLRWVLGHPPLTLLVTAAAVGLNIYLYVIVPKGFFPQQDTGRLTGTIVGNQDISFPAMKSKLDAFLSIVQADPAVENVVGVLGGASVNTGRTYIQLKDWKHRNVTADQVINRLRARLARVPGATSPPARR